MRRFNLLCCAVLALFIAGHFGKAQWETTQHTTRFIQALRRNDLKKARAYLQEEHDWDILLKEIAACNDTAIYQRAIDVQFLLYEHPHGYPHFSRYEQRLDVIQRLVAIGAHPTYDNLVDAIRQGKTSSAYYFLRHGVAATGTPGDNRALIEATSTGDPRLVRFMIHHGANVNATCNADMYRNRWCPLLATIDNGRLNIAKILLAQGADPLLTDQQNYPAWKVLRSCARARYIDGTPAYPENTTKIWSLVKPAVEKRWGYALPE